MDRTFVNVIYMDKQNNRFAFAFILLFLLIPNLITVLVCLVLFGKDLLKESQVILPLGIYTIVNAIIIVLSYFILENNKEKSVRLLDEGIIYNSLTKRFAVPWNCVYRIRMNPFLSARPSVFVYTTKGRFFFTGMYVDLAEELPKIKPGFLKPKYYYQSGGEYNPNIHKNELYLALKEKLPDKFF